MPGSKSDYLENAVLDFVLGRQVANISPTTYLGLFTGAISETSQLEVIGGAYARVNMGNSANWQASGLTGLVNKVVFTFPAATAPWGTITGFGIFDAAAGGHLLYWGTTNPMAIVTGDVASFPIGQLTIFEDGSSGAATDGKSDFLESWILRNVLQWDAGIYTPPASVVARLYTAISDASGTELTAAAGGYAPVTIPNNATNWPAAVGGIKRNGATIQFPNATNTWPTVNGFAITDAVAGAILFWCITPARTLTAGQSIRVNVDGFQIIED